MGVTTTEHTTSEARGEDVHDLHQLGYAQLLLRDIGGFASFAISFSIISVVTGAAGLYGDGLRKAGALGIMAGWPLVTMFSLAIAAAMAEIASSIPTAGAMYHWATFIGNRAWGWFTGWFNVIGQYAITAGIDYSLAEFIAPLLGLETSWPNLMGLTLLFLMVHGLFCHFGIRLCAALNDFSAWYHIGIVAAIVVGVLGFTQHAPWSQLVSTVHAEPSTLGLPAEASYGLLFLVGLMPAMWIYTGYDASAHISEETNLPRVNAPWGIYMAVAVSGLAGWLMMMALTLAIDDMPKALASPNPFFYALETAFGATLGQVALWLVAGCMWFCGLSSMVSAGRTVYAFARDGGMPAVFAAVSPTWRTPVAATWQVVAVAFLLVLFLTWRGVSLVPIVATAAISLNVCYAIPIALRLVARARGQWPERFDGPWTLGRWSTLVSVMAVAWVVVVCVVFMWPPNQLVAYTFAGLTAALTALWLLVERKRFRGPRRPGTEEELYEMEQRLVNG